MTDPWAVPITAPAAATDPERLRAPRHQAWRYLGGATGLLVYVVPWTLPGPGRFLEVLSLLLFVPVLPHISFRKRDFLLLLMPYYGFVYAWRFGWRAALLPDRDWAPREDEMPADSD